jgi:hypothetical protein
MTGRRELPLRIFDDPAGPVIRCLCGAEAALMDPPRAQPAVRHSVPDASPAALLRMVLHAKQCQRGQYEQLEQSARRPAADARSLKELSA